MNRARFLLLVVLAALFGGCATSSKPSGHLVIVGGGLKDDNAAIHERFVSLCADGPIGIIPTASGDGMEAGEHAAAQWLKWSGKRAVIVLPLTKDDAAKANDKGIAQTIEMCGGLWFTGGDQSRIVAVLRPDGQDTLAMQAVRHVLDKGGAIGGTSAGAAMMSDPMITGGRSRSGKSGDPDNEDAGRVRTGTGLGLFPFGLTDQHFLQRGRMGRLIDAMHDTGITRGYGVSENCALIVPIDDDFFETIGERSVCVIDMPSPDIPESGIRLSVFGTCKSADISCENLNRTSAPAQRAILATKTAPSTRDVESVWTLQNVSSALDALCAEDKGVIELRDERTVLTLTADEHTEVIDLSGSRSILNIRLDIQPRR